jgi:hypothetical protein
MRKQLATLIDEKIDLVNRTRKQMSKDVEDGVLQPGTLEIFHKANMSFISAKEKLAIDTEKEDLEALFLFGRGNWNMGEFHARVKQDKENIQKE